VVSMVTIIQRANVLESGNTGHQHYAFVVPYLVQVLLSQLVYYPVLHCILFSGVLGCGVLPVLGGRPRQVILMERAKTEKV